MKKFLTYMLSACLLTGCLDIKLEDQYSDPDAVSTTQRARELLSSAYNALPRFQMEFSVLGDDFVPTNLASKNADLLNLYNWQENAIDDLSSSVWTEYYHVVSLVNALLPRLDDVSVKDADDAVVLDRIRSEAKALKAMCYFDLLRLYGPTWSEDNMEKDAIILKDRLELEFLPRSSLKKCVDEVASLLEEAVGTENGNAEIYCLSTPAVMAMQAEVELFRENFSEAANIGSRLLTDAENRWTSSEYNALWSENSSAERLFAPYIFTSFYTDLCYDKNSGDYYVLNDGIVFDEEDMRKAWTGTDCITGTRQVRNFGKYNRMYYENTDVRYINSLRYSGVCFTVAEACARAGKEGEAVELMNRYLSARGAALFDRSLSGAALVEAILREKQKEFAGEGTRIFDLKRTGAGLKRYGTFGDRVSSTVKSGDYRWLFPIPKSEYRYNKYAVQNPGWPVLAVD